VFLSNMVLNKILVNVRGTEEIEREVEFLKLLLVVN
jgi:hypothetical protein